MSPDIGQIKNALTVDLEDWYHGLTRTMKTPALWHSFKPRATESTSILLDLLAEAGVKATFFILGDLAVKSPELILRIADAGHELGSHGYSHQLINRMQPQQFRDEIIKCQKIVQDSTGKAMIGFRAPQFSMSYQTPWAFEILAESGFEYDSSIFPMKTLLYGTPGANPLPHKPFPDCGIMEYPVSTIRWAGITIPVSGGVYNRFYPYWFIHWAIESLNKRSIPAILYLHPWELDLYQPRIKVSPRERLTHYGNRKTVVNKLRHLLQDFKFNTLGNLHLEYKNLNV